MFSATVLPWLKRDVPVLDADPPTAVDDALVLGDVTGGEHALGRWSRACVDADSAGLAELEPAAAGEHHVGVDAGADHDRVGLELAPGLGHDLRHAAVGPLEAIELVVAVDLDPVRLEDVVEEPGGLAARSGG